MKSLTNFNELATFSGELSDLKEIAKAILELLPKSAIVLLNGNLAAGKTTLVSYIAKELGLNGASSPTFSLQQCYGDNIFHYDFYRVDFNQIVSLGLVEEFEKSGIHFVEWASDELLELLTKSGFKVYSIDIVPKDSGREYKVGVYNG